MVEIVKVGDRIAIESTKTINPSLAKFLKNPANKKYIHKAKDDVNNLCKVESELGITHILRMPLLNEPKERDGEALSILGILPQENRIPVGYAIHMDELHETFLKYVEKFKNEKKVEEIRNSPVETYVYVRNLVNPDAPHTFVNELILQCQTKLYEDQRMKLRDKNCRRMFLKECASSGLSYDVAFFESDSVVFITETRAHTLPQKQTEFSLEVINNDAKDLIAKHKKLLKIIDDYGSTEVVIKED